MPTDMDDNQNQPLNEEQLKQLLAQIMGGNAGRSDQASAMAAVPQSPEIAPPEQTPNDTIMPSFGERIGAKMVPANQIKMPSRMSPSPSTDSASAPSSTLPAALDISPGSGSQPDITAGLDRKAVPAAPVGARNPTRMDLLRQQGEFGKPLDRGAVDPATGKPKYKMGWGQRLLGTFANAASGFARNDQPVVQVGPGATNRRYQSDEATREANLKNGNKQLEGQEKLDTSNLNLEKQAQRELYESQIGEARSTAANAQAETAGMKTSLADSQRELNEARAEKDRQPKEPQTEPEIALAKQMAILKGDKAKAAMYDAALKDLARQKAAGKDTSAADVAKAIQVAEFRTKQKADLDHEQEQERNKRYGELEKNIDLKLDDKGMAAAKAKVDSDLETKYAPKAQGINDQADQMLGLTKAGGKLKTPPADNKTPPEKPASPPPAGRAWVYNKKTGARGTIPQAQLKTATEGPNAQYGTW